jgi:hypothetical protein
MTLLSPAIAQAYEFVEVGGGQGSAETKAMNIQAYETNNRLEKAGLKIETPAEQSKSLSAALSEYSYEPSSTARSRTEKAKIQSTTKNGKGMSK